MSKINLKENFLSALSKIADMPPAKYDELPNTMKNITIRPERSTENKKNGEYSPFF